jgi:uncharacterized protein YndB with AHSA1/START domain
MTARSAYHATFVIERRLAASAAKVFAAWADPAKKRRWFACHDDWQTLEHHLDFRVGGSERNAVAAAGAIHRMEAQYLDIVPDARIVYAYAMAVGDVRISVSLVTVAFEERAAATLMTFTEQVVFLDGHGALDERREGTAVGLDRLVALVDGAAVAAGSP